MDRGKGVLTLPAQICRSNYRRGYNLYSDQFSPNTSNISFHERNIITATTARIPFHAISYHIYPHPPGYFPNEPYINYPLSSPSGLPPALFPPCHISTHAPLTIPSDPPCLPPEGPFNGMNADHRRKHGIYTSYSDLTGDLQHGMACMNDTNSMVRCAR